MAWTPAMNPMSSRNPPGGRTTSEPKDDSEFPDDCMALCRPKKDFRMLVASSNYVGFRSAMKAGKTHSLFADEVLKIIGEKIEKNSDDRVTAWLQNCVATAAITARRES